MRLLGGSFALIVGAIGEALFPAPLVRVALGMPPEFCPVGALAVAVSVTQLAAKLTFILACLWIVRDKLGASVKTSALASLLAVSTGFVVATVLMAPPVFAWSVELTGSVGGSVQAQRWATVIAAGTAAGLVFAFTHARQNNELQRTSDGKLPARR